MKKILLLFLTILVFSLSTKSQNWVTENIGHKRHDLYFTDYSGNLYYLEFIYEAFLHSYEYQTGGSSELFDTRECHYGFNPEIQRYIYLCNNKTKKEREGMLLGKDKALFISVEGQLVELKNDFLANLEKQFGIKYFKQFYKEGKPLKIVKGLGRVVTNPIQDLLDIGNCNCGELQGVISDTRNAYKKELNKWLGETNYDYGLIKDVIQKSRQIKYKDSIILIKDINESFKGLLNNSDIRLSDGQGIYHGKAKIIEYNPGKKIIYTKHGYGVYKYNNGFLYYGNWKEGYRDGPGILIKNTKKVKFKEKNGRLIISEKEGEEIIRKL